jgi:hypothetical protein
VRRVLAAFAVPPVAAKIDTLRDFLLADSGFLGIWLEHAGERNRLRIDREGTLLGRRFWVVPEMAPGAGAPSTWQVPQLPTTEALADWLGLDLNELLWLADCHGREAWVPPGPLRHYLYRLKRGRRGKVRLLEIPKPRLKGLQQHIAREVLACIPPHEAVHSYRRGRSVASYVAPHAGRALVLHLDLRDFFPSLRPSRVHALFRKAGYPTPVARLLTGLCTNVVPPEVVREGALDARIFLRPHVPQGAPTSPALANLCAYRLDCRLAGLAKAAGAVYTRYADDLVFSGGDDFLRVARRFHVHAARIALEEGFEVNTRKTQFLRPAVRQQVAGIVLNAHPNVNRRVYDQLKAILCNCLRHGAASQNREGHPDFRAHLLGRIAYVAMLNPARGQRLRALFDRIRWE